FKIAFLAIDDVVLQHLLQGEILARRGAAASPLVREQSNEVQQRVVTLAAAVIDQIQRRLPLFGRNTVLGEDARGVQDGGGQPPLLRLVEIDAVQHLPRLRLQAEADVREPEQHAAVGEALRDQLDPVERLEAQAAVVLVAGGNGEGQWVEEDI